MTDDVFLRIIAHNTRDVISIFDAGFKRHFISESVYDLTGYSVDEIMQMEVGAPIPPEDSARIRPIIQEHLTMRQSCLVEHRLIHKDGSIRWVEVLVRPIENGENLQWILTSARDITDRKLKQKELDEEKKLREHLLKLSTLSHDIRTPLTSLMGVVQLLASNDSSKEQTQLINSLRASGEILLGMFDNLLDFAKLREGTFGVVPTDFDFHGLCDRIAVAASGLATQKGLELRFKIARDVPRFVVSDPQKITQILNNLLTNSIKFTTSGAIIFEVYQLEDSVAMQITDTGAGIPGNLQEQVFEPFVQGEIVNDSKLGIGLGLSIVKELVSILGGEIKLQSMVNHGTTVLVTIPVGKSGQEAERVPMDINGMKVLIVEDVVTSLEVYRRLLSKYGAICEGAVNLTEALALTNRHEFDVILLDMHLEDQSGLQLLDMLQATGTTTPVIAFTADSADATIKSAREAGVAEVVIKPVAFDSLVSTLLKYRRSLPFDLSIYGDLYENNNRAYRDALSLLKSDFLVFESCVKKSTNLPDEHTLRKAIHRIRPIAKQISYVDLLTLLSELENMIEAKDWTHIHNQSSRLASMRTVLMRTIDSQLQTRDEE